MKRIISLFVSLLLTVSIMSYSVFAAGMDLGSSAKSTLLMEASSGKILFSDNADIPLPPASVTKIMTLLLVAEAIDSGTISFNDTVSVSENAASKGGSQVFLEAGESITVHELLKSVAVASGNDAAVALAEVVSGSEDGFTAAMNSRAAELGMISTHFENPTGLDDDTETHVTSAADIAIMSRELLKHSWITDYTSIWMDTIRDGAFGLSNTNRLIRFYKGANGLKTGSTSKAGFCISATAERNGMTLIAVVMGSPTRDIRNETAKKLLDYGYANYSRIIYQPQSLGTLKVLGGTEQSVTITVAGFDTVVAKSNAKQIESSIILPESIEAPLYAGQQVGTVEYSVNGEVVGNAAITVDSDIPHITYFGILLRLFNRLFSFNFSK